MFSIVRSMYDWVLEKSTHRFAAWFLSLIAFLESSIFPIPPDVMLIPMCLGAPKKSFWFATICTVSSVLGGILGYYIGMFFYEAIGQDIISFYQLEPAFLKIQFYFKEYGVWFLLLAGITPIPYKVFAIGAGVFQMVFLPFVLTSIVGRGFRFFLVSLLIYWIGPPVRTWIDRYFNWLMILFGILFIGSFILLKYI